LNADLQEMLSRDATRPFEPRIPGPWPMPHLEHRTAAVQALGWAPADARKAESGFGGMRPKRNGANGFRDARCRERGSGGSSGRGC